MSFHEQVLVAVSMVGYNLLTLMFALTSPLPGIGFVMWLTVGAIPSYIIFKGIVGEQK